MESHNFLHSASHELTHLQADPLSSLSCLKAVRALVTPRPHLSNSAKDTTSPTPRRTRKNVSKQAIDANTSPSSPTLAPLNSHNQKTTTPKNPITAPLRPLHPSIPRTTTPSQRPEIHTNTPSASLKTICGNGTASLARSSSAQRRTKRRRSGIGIGVAEVGGLEFTHEGKGRVCAD